MAKLPEETYTVDQFIDAGSSTIISYNNLSYIQTMSNGNKAPFFNVINDYIDELVSFSCTIELTDSEFQKYLYKPKLLCKDIYGNPELYFIILRLNNMANVKQFNRRKIKLLPKTSMDTAISLIYNAEKKLLDEYNDRD